MGTPAHMLIGTGLVCTYMWDGIQVTCMVTLIMAITASITHTVGGAPMGTDSPGGTRATMEAIGTETATPAIRRTLPTSAR